MEVIRLLLFMLVLKETLWDILCQILIKEKVRRHSCQPRSRNGLRLPLLTATKKKRAEKTRRASFLNAILMVFTLNSSLTAFAMLHGERV
jgi:hypothetical protein